MKNIQELENEIEQIKTQANIEIGKRIGQIELLKEQEQEKEKKK